MDEALEDAWQREQSNRQELLTTWIGCQNDLVRSNSSHAAVLLTNLLSLCAKVRSPGGGPGAFFTSPHRMVEVIATYTVDWRALCTPAHADAAVRKQVLTFFASALSLHPAVDLPPVHLQICVLTCLFSKSASVSERVQSWRLLCRGSLGSLGIEGPHWIASLLSSVELRESAATFLPAICAALREGRASQEWVAIAGDLITWLIKPMTVYDDSRSAVMHHCIDTLIFELTRGCTARASTAWATRAPGRIHEAALACLRSLLQPEDSLAEMQHTAQELLQHMNDGHTGSLEGLSTPSAPAPWISFFRLSAQSQTQLEWAARFGRLKGEERGDGGGDGEDAFQAIDDAAALSTLYRQAFETAVRLGQSGRQLTLARMVTEAAAVAPFSARKSQLISLFEALGDLLSLQRAATFFTSFARPVVPSLADMCVGTLLNATPEETGGYHYSLSTDENRTSWPLAAQQLEHLICRPAQECAYCMAWVLDEHATPVIAKLDLPVVGATEVPVCWTLCAACCTKHRRGPGYRGIRGLVDGSTLLHDAAKRGDSCTVARLVRLGLGPDEFDVRGHTPLMDVVFELEGVKRGETTLAADSAVAVVSTLLDNAASITCQSPAAGASSLHIAAEEDSPLGARIVRLMLDHLGSTDVDSHTRDGDSALGLACMSGCTATVEVLLAAGASVTHRNHRNATPLHMAVEAVPESKGALAIKALAASKQRAELISSLEWATFGDGDTALLTAIRLNNGTCCALLLELKASPHACSAEGGSAIFFALLLSSGTCAAHLLAAGADPHTALPVQLRRLLPESVTTPAAYSKHYSTLSKECASLQCWKLIRETVARNDATPLYAIEEAKRAANTHYQMGDHPQAVVAYEQAIQQWHIAGATDAGLTCLYAFNNLGATLYANCAASHLQVGAAEKALCATGEVLKLVPRHVKALLRQAAAHEKMGDHVAAIARAGDVLFVEPRNVQARAILCAGGPGALSVSWAEGDYDDWREKPAKAVRLLSAPLSLLAALEQLLFLDERRLGPVPTAVLAAFSARTLRVHVIGCTGGVDDACEWAALAARLPFCEALEVTLVGFMGARFARPFRVAPRPPLDCAAPAPDSRLRTGPVLLHRLHGLYHAMPPQSEGREPPKLKDPHVAFLRNPQLGLYLDQWAETIWRLIEQRTLTVVTFGDDEVGQSRMYPTIEVILRRLGAKLLPALDTDRGTPSLHGMFFSPRRRKEAREWISTCAFLGPDEGSNVFDLNMDRFHQGGLEAALPPIIDDLNAQGIRTLHEVAPLQGKTWLGLLSRYSY